MSKYDLLKSRTKTYEVTLRGLKQAIADNKIKQGCGTISLVGKYIRVDHSSITIDLPDETLKAYIHADQLLREYLEEAINTNNEKLLAIETLLSEGESNV